MSAQIDTGVSSTVCFSHVRELYLLAKYNSVT